MGRKGVSPAEAEAVVLGENTVVAALMLRRGDADAMLCGTVGRFNHHFQHVSDIIGKGRGIGDFSTLVAMILPSGTYFVCDSHVTSNPTAEEIAEMTILSAAEVRRFGITPKVALLSHSTFGSYQTESARKMREARRILEQRVPELEVDGEMQADVALSLELRDRVFPGSRLTGEANLLVMPNVDAANISYNLIKMLGGGVTVGPILVGAGRPVHVLTKSTTVRGLVNMSAVTVVQAQIRAEESLSAAPNTRKQ